MRRFFKVMPLAVVLVLLTSVLFGCGGGGGDAKGKIVGIEPGAGIMSATEAAIEQYGLDFQLQDSSSAAMAASLKRAIDNEEWIVVTGWTPHWKFAQWDLKYLDDPKGVYGGEEEIATIARTGLKDDMPEVYEILDKFYWAPADMEAVMLDIQGGMTPDEAAEKWIENNQDKVNAWLPEQEAAEKGKVTLGYVEWDSEIASTHLVKNVLEKAGYQVEPVAVDAGVMWTGIANGDFDAIVSAWLPLTHGDYYAKVKDNVDNLGPNLEGAKIGLVVPTYVTIDSIEELNDVKDKFQ
ncbi:glycine betaine ABC transporter substrate-binding protein [Desulfallas thermosapovorans]|uniref:Glycine betaine/proline transport system substrate-binding protein n=1 Tax=Desulfallas thermosapovorans DSM 6562 TaxID=1121431 RepID=A0A5S4ZXF1_9FIRM|nr:glycine betaine ABC transporter substrate-binding protein [Desulfallas thermosapovorans]TYO97390.1 glycine betaine/proline transport system substrate-binding protein [Desulfallas thermosapovorans DSM 6562]